MRIFDYIEDLSTLSAQSVVYAIGNFDGLHQGHQAVIEGALEAARKDDAVPAVISFEPPPRSFFHPDQPQQRLSPPDVKAQLIARTGVSFLLNLPFDQRLAEMPAEDFISKILQEKLTAKHIVVGQNFRFGKDRQGDAQFLSAQTQIGVDIIRPVIINGEIVSSTTIRLALSQGLPQKAAQLLGRWWQIKGRVLQGEKRGRHIGFPTLNLALTDYALPALGVYAARVLIKQAWFDAIINIGYRPTFGNQAEPLLEAHLFGAQGDFYDAEAQIFLLAFIRAEKKFNDIKRLKAQIKQDIEKVSNLCQKITAQNEYSFWEVK